MFSQNIHNYTCANHNTTDNTGKRNVKLQNPSEANYNGDNSDYFFVIDTCMSLISATGLAEADCESE